MASPKSDRGFSVIEIMVAVTIIGILSMLSIPAIERSQDATRASTFANDIRQFSSAVETYAIVFGEYPPDSGPGNADSQLKEYLPLNFMDTETPIGGTWDVDMDGAAGVTAAVGVANMPVWDIELLIRIDFAIDDGNLVKGNFRIFPFGGGRVYWIVEE